MHVCFEFVLVRSRIQTKFPFLVPCCSESNVSYKDSIFLPKTKFPHRIRPTTIVKRDREIEKIAKFDELYTWQLQHRKGKKFILHDGPPYANGDVHIGHAVNKVLKDITVRNQLLSGAQVNLIPGWDCHGLPIELKVLKNNDVLASHRNAVQLRAKALEFARKTQSDQLAAFKKWGLLADWENSYITCNSEYIAKQWKLFYALYEKKLIYPNYKPVFWSPSNKTSLAEAELEYNSEHVSPSVYIKFPIVNCPDVIKTRLDCTSDLYALVWTTTPWTLPANQAICYAESKGYCIVQSEHTGEHFIIAVELLDSLKEAFKTNFVIVQQFHGSLLNEFTYAHPLFEGKHFPFLHAHHVTMSKGTGLVHMAPNHGFEDYASAMEHGVSISPCIVGEDGCFLPEAGADLIGKDVLGSGNKTVLELMSKYIVLHVDYKHSYPYDWRSNKPVIIRSSYQWFIDVESLKEPAKTCLCDVDFIPRVFQKAFLNQLTNSPPWCISRQRVWGVPIPVFYQGERRTPVINGLIIEHLCKLLKEKGIHFWWQLSEEQLLPPDLRKKCNLTDDEYKKGSDILDIWFDSGISWHNVLPEPHVSDICIEGVDQMRGWFRSSLLTSVALRGIAPYRRLFFHGFITDDEGLKMSKSKGNVVSPMEIIEGSKKSPAMGVDVLRWWVAYHGCQHEKIPLKYNILDDCSENVAKFRNVLKFLLGNLYQFDYAADKVEHHEMKPLDQYMLHLTNVFLKKVEACYNMVQYKAVATHIIDFVANDVSAFYCQSVKDRLYCDLEGSVSRRSCQTTLSVVLDVLIRCLAPVMPHLAEEVFLYHPRNMEGTASVFRTDWGFLEDALSNTSFLDAMLWAYEVRSTILKSEKKTIDQKCVILGNDKLLEQLKSLQPTEEAVDGNLCEMFQVSKVHLMDSSCNTELQDSSYTSLQGVIDTSLNSDLVSYTVLLKPSTLKPCPRCRRFTSANELELCQRCKEVVRFKNKS